MLRRQLRRADVEKFFAKLPACLVSMEACSSAHHWARVTGRYGHEVRLMPPAYVKPYVKTNNNDGRHAEGVCEAVGRPTMRFVAVKSVEQQATLAVHGTRALLVCRRTMAAYALRAALSEPGIVAAQGYEGLRKLIARLEEPSEDIPEMMVGPSQIHCRAGIGRSSLMAACALVCIGVEAKAALALIGAARGLTVPDPDEQRERVLTFAE